MVSFCTVPCIQVGMLLLVLTCFISCSTIGATSLKDKFEELEVKLDSKVYQLEVKVKQLEAKNTKLEIKVQEQESILTLLLLQKNQSESPAGSNLISRNRKTTLQSTARRTPRTCQELREADPSLPSGMQWIDPDGEDVGDNPIFVYCDMLSGSTSILHDSESNLNVGHCADPGCYSRSVNYNMSIGQIKALAKLSTECHQSIKYDCYYAPFEFDKVPYSWWNDRDGNPQYFWAGSNSNGIHTCQCGIAGNCVDVDVKCNCDTLAPMHLADNGIITDKNILPVTRLNFGRTQLDASSGIHTLGRLECTGTVATTGLPSSCEDLWLIGHTLNGIYSIMGPAMMESVYCDFTKHPDNEDFQKWIGYADVKSAPVHFYVLKNSSFNATRVPISFEIERLNVGNAMDLPSGIFTAPRPGTYFFTFTGLAQFPSSSSPYFYSLGVGLYLNGDRIGTAYVEETNTIANQNDQLTIQSTLKLKSGDRVWVLIERSSGVYVYDNENNYSHFTGFMLEEEIAVSL